MTVRLRILVLTGLAVVSAAGGVALSLRGPAATPKVSPTWGFFDDAQWRALGSHVAASGLDAASLQMVTATGKDVIVVSARRASGRRCFVVLRHGVAGAPICRLTQPLTVFASRSGTRIDLAGLVQQRVVTVVYSWRAADGSPRKSGVALMPAGSGAAFGLGYSSGPLTLAAYDARGRVIARLYCASALRGVCGMSAQRRS